MRNVVLASSHPCYVVGGYECDCGFFAEDLKKFRKHVKHYHTYKYAKKVCSVQDLKILYPKKPVRGRVTWANAGKKKPKIKWITFKR